MLKSLCVFAIMQLRANGYHLLLNYTEIAKVPLKGGPKMLMRKINAGLSLITTFLLLDHAIFHAVWMISLGTIEKNSSIVSRALFSLMLVHAAISIGFAISGHAGTEKRKCKSYPKLNAATMVQRIGGIALIVFAVLHVAGAVGFMQPPKLVHAILPPVFFTVALVHVAISASKAFITLGIGNAKLVKAVDIVIKVVCAATLIAALTGFYLYQV